MFDARVKLKVPSTTPISPILVLLTLLLYAVPTHAFFRHLCHGELGNGRVDPIMSPGHPSQHLHVMFGASNLGFDPTVDDLLSSNCTSCSILQDHSAYWSPRMYFQHSNGTLEMVPTSGGLTVYYFTEPIQPNVSVTAFPQNFRMIAGNSNKRTFYGAIPDPPMSNWTDSDRTQQSLMEKATGFNCLHYNNAPNEGAREFHYLRNKTFLDSTCTDGVRAELMFPSCWNGVDLDSDNHTTHVAYPSEVQDGVCPEGFPVKLPTLFYETIYQTNLFAGVDGQFTFSNGDPTGFGYHGDFMAAWDDGVLQNAIDDPQCNMPTNLSGNQEDCPIFQVQDVNAGPLCQMETPAPLQDEAINLIPVLPGNVQIQSGPGSATMPGATPPASNTAGPSPANPTPGPTASTAPPSCSDETKLTTTPPPSMSQFTTTTSYMSSGVMVYMILIEEVVTVTVPGDAAPSSGSEPVKRHLHLHGHRNGRGRL